MSTARFTLVCLLAALLGVGVAALLARQASGAPGSGAASSCGGCASAVRP